MNCHVSGRKRKKGFWLRYVMNANPVCATNVYTRVFDVMRTRNGTRAVGVALVYLIGSACCGLSFDMYVYASFEYSLSSVLSFLFLRYYRWPLNFFIWFSTSFYFFLSLFERFSTHTVCPASFLSRFAARKLSALPFVLHLSLDFMLLYWNLYRDLDKDFLFRMKRNLGNYKYGGTSFPIGRHVRRDHRAHRVAEYICMHTP